MCRCDSDAPEQFYCGHFRANWYYCPNRGVDKYGDPVPCEEALHEDFVPINNCCSTACCNDHFDKAQQKLVRKETKYGFSRGGQWKDKPQHLKHLNAESLQGLDFKGSYQAREFAANRHAKKCLPKLINGEGLANRVRASRGLKMKPLVKLSLPGDPDAPNIPKDIFAALKTNWPPYRDSEYGVDEEELGGILDGGQIVFNQNPKTKAKLKAKAGGGQGAQLGAPVPQPWGFAPQQSGAAGPSQVGGSAYASASTAGPTDPNVRPPKRPGSDPQSRSVSEDPTSNMPELPTRGAPKPRTDTPQRAPVGAATTGSQSSDEGEGQCSEPAFFEEEYQALFGPRAQSPDLIQDPEVEKLRQIEKNVDEMLDMLEMIEAPAPFAEHYTVEEQPQVYVKRAPKLHKVLQHSRQLITQLREQEPIDPLFTQRRLNDLIGRTQTVEQRTDRHLREFREWFQSQPKQVQEQLKPMVRARYSQSQQSRTSQHSQGSQKSQGSVTAQAQQQAPPPSQTQPMPQPQPMPQIQPQGHQRPPQTQYPPAPRDGGRGDLRSDPRDRTERSASASSKDPRRRQK